jgi:nitrate/nitrite-specific signal transduction histidine kinase
MERMGKRSSSLGTKIIVWFFVPTAIILIAVALVTFYAYQRVTEELVIERDQELTRLSANQLKTELSTYVEVLDALTRIRTVYEGDPAAQQDAFQAAGSRLATFDGGVFVIDTFGVVSATTPADRDHLGLDWSDQDFYREMVTDQINETPRPVFTDIILPGLDETQVIAIAVPIAGEQDEFIGILVGVFRLDGTAEGSTFYRNISDLRIGKGGKTYIIDSNRRVIFHTDARLIGQNLAENSVSGQIVFGQSAALRHEDDQGDEILLSYAPIPETPWSLVVEEEWSALTSGSRGYQSFLLILLALGVIIPAFVVAFGVRRVMTPIEDLIGGAKAIANGEFGHHIDAGTGDEIEELADQFNIMSAQLEQSYATLEQRVADRTKELSALYAVASVVNRSLDLKKILEGALQKTIEVTGIETGGIYLLDHESGNLKITVHCGVSDRFIAGVDNLAVGEGFSGRVFQQGKPIVVNDVAADPRLTRSVVREEGYHSVAIVPLSSRAKIHGTLFLLTKTSRTFSEQDIELVSSIGQQIGGAIENARLLEAEARRTEQFRVISEVGSQITSILELDALLDQMARLIYETFDYYLVEIGLIEGEELVFKSGVGGEWVGEFREFRLPLDEKSLTGWAALHSSPAMIPDVAVDPRYTRVSSVETKSELVLPLQVKNTVIGVLNVESDRLSAFNEGDLAVLQLFAAQASIAIDNARLLEREMRRADQFQVLSKVGSQITSILDVDNLLDTIARSIKETFGYYLITIGLIEGEDLVFRAGLKTKADNPVFIPPQIKVGEQGITAWVAANGRPLLVNDVTKDDRYLIYDEASETRAELAVPLMTASGVIGVLNVESNRVNAFDESDLTVLQTLAQQAAIAIENARLYERARELAVIDERNRLARDLHDSVTQTLFSSSLIAEVLPRLWHRDHEEGIRRLEELRLLSRGALAEMRTLLLELRPATLIEADIEDLLAQLAEVAKTRGQVPVEVEVTGEYPLPDDVKINLYHIAQEAMNNIVKHAEAERIQVHLDLDAEAVTLTVIDNGIGFDPAENQPEHLGLEIMRERADAIGGKLIVKSESGAGTKITCTWVPAEGQAGGI